MGLGRAKEMILTGARWDARQALAAGLVSEVVPPAELPAAARASAERGARPGPAGRAAGQAGSQRVHADAPRRGACVYESTAQAITFESKDKLEGTTAFLEKRPARFTGE